ncbi:hypothetical protein I316_06328 [Kwoniella heveanensis BCC8398]|uniref:Uncharacterized protein n=1 Tax=Kwoniella heveanensis BCC8398 TaxID=1296120 RepID=A0A1B9GM56_9TREE|nr:hypothetical protein I316_06328 [Kwoniella heveanensis BCC8398]
MSKKVVDWESEERKLQPIYDDISNHRLTQAQSALARYLKKSPKSQPGLIIKMYILQKMGSAPGGDEEILGLYETVKGLGEISGRGIWWIGLTLRNMGRLDLALELYMNLAANRPDTLVLQEEIFRHAAAAGNVDVMTQSSKKCYNLSGRDERWGRLAAWAEWVKNAPQPTPSLPYPAPAPPNSLKIATLLLNASSKPPLPLTSETLWLKTQILLSSGQKEEAVKLLQTEGSKGALARLWWRLGVRDIIETLEGDSVQKAWEEERVWVSKLLKEEKEARRNYAFYRHLIITTEKLGPNNAVVKATDDLFKSLHEKIGNKERAPALARLELQALLRSQGAQGEVVWSDENWSKAVEQYWIQWGSKGSIVTELVGIVGEDKIRQDLVLKFLVEQVGQKHTDEQTFCEQADAEIYLLRQRETGWRPTSDDIRKYWNLYAEGLVYGKSLPKTDVKPSDNIGLITVSLLLEQWQTEHNDEILYKAILCLETIITHSPACVQARYLLIRLYRLTGAPSLIPAHLKTLNLSEIQLDNLLHVYTERGASEVLLTGEQGLWSDQTDKAVAMYKRTTADFPEYVKECLSNETYSKIPSLRYLTSSIANSLSQQVMTIERSRLIIQSGSIIGSKTLDKLQKIQEITPVDLRNWEWIFEIGGNRGSVRKIIQLENAISPAWTKASAQLLGSIGKVYNGEQVDRMDIASEGLLPTEVALIQSVSKVINATSQALGHTEGEVASNEEVKAVFQDNIRAAEQSYDTRWETLQSLTILAELIKIVDLLLNRLVELSKPAKGKKKPAAIVQLVSDFKAAKEALVKTDLKAVVDKVDRLIKAEDGSCWNGIAEEGLLEKDIIEDIGESITRSRKEALQASKALLLGKNPSTGAASSGASGKKK